MYPGVVVWVKGEQCRVRFDVYENEEELELCALLPPEESQTEDEADNQVGRTHTHTLAGV